MLSLSLDPADPALRVLIIQAASHEFVTHRLTSHAMLLMGIFYGKLQMIATIIKKLLLLKISELTAVPINYLWANRQGLRERTVRTNYTYDVDFNLIIRNPDENGNLQIYMLNPADVARNPCAQLEQLVHHMSRDYHQALLVLHISFQGTLLLATFF